MGMFSVCMNYCVFGGVCMHICICRYISTYMYVRMLDCVHVCVECMCRVYCICVRVSLSVRLRVAAFQTRLVKSGPVTGDLDSRSLWTRYIGD